LAAFKNHIRSGTDQWSAIQEDSVVRDQAHTYRPKRDQRKLAIVSLILLGVLALAGGRALVEWNIASTRDDKWLQGQNQRYKYLADWRRVDVPEFVGKQEYVSVTAVVEGHANSPWMAAGYVVDARGRRHPTVWQSNDAIHWKEEELPSTSRASQDRVFLLSRHRRVTVAAGSTPGRGPAEGVTVPVIWARKDGGDWRVVTTDREISNPYVWNSIQGLSSTDTGVIATGRSMDLTPETKRDVGIWMSTNGLEWSNRSKGADELNDLKEGDQPIGWAAASSGSHTIVVGGVSRGTRQIGAVWTSATHGVAWQPIENLPGTRDGVNSLIEDVVFHEGRFIATGVIQEDERSLPALWISRDGIEWALRNPNVVGRGFEGSFSQIEIANDRLIVTGEVDDELHLWESTDGSSWRAIPLPDRLRDVSLSGYPMDVAANGSRLVVTVPGEGHSDVWSRVHGRWRELSSVGNVFSGAGKRLTLLDVTSDDATFLAVGRETNAQNLSADGLWISRTGESWSQVNATGIERSQLTSATALGGMYVVGGTRIESTRLFRPSVWMSEDGRNWHQSYVDQVPPLGHVADLYQDGDRLLALVNAVDAKGRPTGIYLSSWDGTSWQSMPQISARGDMGTKLCGDKNDIVVLGRVNGTGTASVWKTEEGRWHQTLLSSTTEMTDCAVHESEAVIVGADGGNGTAWVWESASWNPLGHDGAFGYTAPPSEIYVVLPGEYFYALGASPLGGEHEFTTWLDEGSSEWSRTIQIQEPGADRPTALARRGNRLVAIGRHGPSAAVWIGDMSARQNSESESPSSQTSKLSEHLDACSEIPARIEESEPSGEWGEPSGNLKSSLLRDAPSGFDLDSEISLNVSRAAAGHALNQAVQKSWKTALPRHNFIRGQTRRWIRSSDRETLMLVHEVYEFDTPTDARAFQAWVVSWLCIGSIDVFGVPSLPSSYGRRLRFDNRVVDEISYVAGNRHYFLMLNTNKGFPPRHKLIGLVNQASALAKP
jgi:hypothetical protein